MKKALFKTVAIAVVSVLLWEAVQFIGPWGVMNVLLVVLFVALPLVATVSYLFCRDTDWYLAKQSDEYLCRRYVKICYKVAYGLASKESLPAEDIVKLLRMERCCVLRGYVTFTVQELRARTFVGQGLVLRGPDDLPTYHALGLGFMPPHNSF